MEDQEILQKSDQEIAEWVASAKNRDKFSKN
jgi:hypothetical protein